MTNATCADFVAAVASANPTPGGGGAAALVGAIGTALGNMVGSLTLKSNKYAAVHAEITALKVTADQLQITLFDLVAADAAAFLPLSAAYRLPKDDPSKADTMEQALLVACQPPLAIMAACGEAIRLQEKFAELGTPMAVSDAGVGAALCGAALRGASLNVFINTASMQDRAKAAALNDEAHALLNKYGTMADALFAAVLTKVGG